MPLSPKQEKELAQLNKKSNLVDRAKRKFGVTPNCQEAGFILENGSMLDFTNRKGGNRSGIHRHEHEEVKEIIKSKDPLFSTDAIAFFQKHANALRFGVTQYSDDGHSELMVQIEADQKPTKAQFGTLVKCCINLHAGSVFYDVYEGGFYGKRLVSQEIETPNCQIVPQTILSEIERAKKNKTEIKFEGDKEA